MPKEIKSGTRVVFDDGSTRIVWSKGVIEIDSSGKQTVRHTQAIGTSEEAIDVGDLTAPYHLIAFNVDATNYVDIYLATGDTNSIRVKAREVAGPVRLTAAPFAKANSAACNLEYLLIED